MPTQTELLTIVRNDESLSSTDVISDASLKILLAEGAVQFASDGTPFILKTSFNTDASQQEYVLSGASPQVTGYLDLYWPTGGMIYAPTSTSTKFPGQDFTIVSEAWLNRELPGWKELTASDTLRHAYIGVNTAGAIVLGLVPKPATTTPSVTLWTVSRGTDMSSTANYPYTNGTTNLPHIEPFTKAIAYWAMHVLHRDKTKLDSEAERYLQLFQGLAQSCRAMQQRVMLAESVGLREEGRVVATQTFGGL